MYFNDVHILVYVLFALIGGAIGQLVSWMNIRLPEYKKVFSKEFFKYGLKPNYVLMAIVAVSYVALLYKFGINTTFIANLDLIKYLFLIPALVSVFVIDYKLQIIPNRLNLAIFEAGLLFLALYGINNLNVAINMALGMVIGGGIFLLITLIGGLIAGREAMGFGDVKLMFGLGLFFGMYEIIAISVLSFLIGAIISIILLVTKIKKTNEYIPFGPFIVIASVITTFVPFEIILNVLMKIFTLGMYQ